jgi:hypothetical protein
MNTDIHIYGNGFNPEVVKDVKDINEKIEKEKNADELLRLRMQRLLRGMELNNGLTTRTYRGYYPY